MKTTHHVVEKPLGMIVDLCVYNGVVLVILRWRKVKSYLMHIETTLI